MNLMLTDTPTCRQARDAILMNELNSCLINSIQQMNDEPTCRCQRNPLIDTLGIQEPVGNRFSLLTYNPIIINTKL